MNFDRYAGHYTLFIDRDSPQLQSLTTGDSVVSIEQVGMDVAISSQTLPNGNIVFHPDGSASANGNVVFVTEGAPTNTMFSVDVLASTGRVRLTEGPPPN